MAADSESVSAIRAVRTAAHELENACRAVVGGAQMAIAISQAVEVGRPLGVSRRVWRRMLRLKDVKPPEKG